MICSKELEEKLRHLVRTTPVVLFLKGRPEAPLCGFSSRALLLLEAAGVEQYTFVDCSISQQQPHPLRRKRQQLREAVKRLFEWETLPLLVAKGTVIGGADILQHLHEQGQLTQILRDATAVDTAEDAAPAAANNADEPSDPQHRQQQQQHKPTA